MELPRFLWVPFPLGRPFGAPGEPDFQRRVLRAALALLERRDGPVVLEDFPDDAPEPEDGGESWACPVSFAPEPGDEGSLARQVLDEIDRLAPWHELVVSRRGHALPAASGLSHDVIVRGLERLAEGEGDPELDTDLPLLEWVRLGCDDLRTWYLDAAQGQPGRAGPDTLQDWLWRDTALARLIAAAAMALAGSDDPARQAFGRRVMVPRAWMAERMPGVEPFV